jgi:ankyrin repeat protein
MYTGNYSQYYNKDLYDSCGYHSKNLTTTSDTNVRATPPQNNKLDAVGASDLSQFQFKDNTERDIDIVKFFEAKYRDYFCTNLKQLIIHLENSKSMRHLVDACNFFKKNMFNKTYNNASLSGITLSVNTNTDFENSKNNLITDSKNLLASYQKNPLEKQESTELNVKLKENNVFFRFFNSVIKLLTKFISFFQQGRMLNSLYKVIDKKNSLNETELTSLINNLNHTNLNKALIYSADKGNNIEIIDMLIKAGADINAKDKFGQTALIKALANDRHATAKKLLEYSPDVNAVTINGNTALTFAASRDLNNNSTDDIIYKNSDKIIDKASKETLNGKQDQGYSALHYAVSHGNLHVVKKLLETNVLVNGNCEIDSYGNTGSILHAILQQTNFDISIGTRLEIIEELLDAEIDIYIKDGNGRTALEFAKLMASSYQDYEPLVELLQEKHELNKLYNVINNSKYLNKTELTNLISKLTPSSLDKALMYSAQQDNVEILSMLVKAGADINATNELNETPLMSALWNYSYATAKKLLEYNPEINTIARDGSTALILAIASLPSNESTDKFIQELIDKSSKKTLSHAGFQGNTALHYAINCSNLYAVKELLKQDVQLNGSCKYNGDNIGSALHISILSGYIDIKTKLEITKLLLEAGINTNIKNGKGKTALECAELIARHRLEYNPLLELLQKYYVPNKSNQITLDADLMYSAQQGDVERIAALVEAGANINTKNKSNATPLIKAISRGRYDAAMKLFEYLPEPDVNNITIDGYTALMFAVGSKLNNNESDNIIIYKLIEKMIDKSNNETLNLQDPKGNTALYYAVRQGNLYAINELMKKNIADDSKKNALEFARLQARTCKEYERVVQLLESHIYN